MPEVVSCPKCQRKSRVPDTLVGKKVKCPGCAEIFTANVNGPAAPKKEEPAKKKPDDDEQEGETYEVVNDRKKRRSDDDDDDERVSDKPRPRRRTEDDDEDDDKPRKSRTSRDDDDDDDDDERVSTRRRFSRDDDDDDDDDDDRGGAVSRKRVPKADWTRVRMGLSLLLASVLTYIGVVIFFTIGICCVGAGAAGMAGNAGAAGKPPGPGAFAGLGVGIIIVFGIYLIGILAAWGLKVGGSVMCLPSPPAFGSKTLALVALILIGVETIAGLLQFTLNMVSNGMAGMMAGAGNPMMGMAPAGAGAAVGQIIVSLLGSVAGIAHMFVIGFYIRSLGLCLRNYSLASTAKGWLITLGATIALTILMVIVFIATIGLVGMNLANQMGAMNAGKPQGPGAAGGAMGGGLILACGLMGIVGILSLVLLVWYIIMLAQARGSITGRMTR